MSDFPRGWTLSTDVSSAATSITIAAIPGVVHVLDGFSAKCVNTTAGAFLTTITLTSSDGVFSGLVLAHLVAPPSNAADSESGSGLDLAAGPGASLTIAYSAFLVGAFHFLLVQGHDI